MGGYGSGRRCTNDLETTYRKLDIRVLAREGVLAAGCECSVQWSGQPLELLRIQASEGELHFRYNTNLQSWQRREVDLPVKLEWTPCNYGGRRPWFLCPRRGCGRRVAILYGASDLGCRTCRRLTYNTQRVPPASRSLERAQRLRVRLGGSVDMTQPFPTRPEGMHFLTYMKRAMLAWRAEDQANAQLIEWVESIQRHS
jgi:hypothetical protein